MNSRGFLPTVLGFLLSILPCAALDRPEPAKDPKNGFRKVKLIAVSRSQTRGQNLVAKFEVLGEKDAKAIQVRFPSHSHTDHENYIMGIIRKSADWASVRNRYAWRKATREVIFSVPKDAGGYKGLSEHYKQWKVLKVEEAKKEKSKKAAATEPRKKPR